MTLMRAGLMRMSPEGQLTADPRKGLLTVTQVRTAFRSPQPQLQAKQTLRHTGSTRSRPGASLMTSADRRPADSRNVASARGRCGLRTAPARHRGVPWRV